ncbi:MAG TPA: CopG family transcriptional regulator [Candidatus Binatia bacterium]
MKKRAARLADARHTTAHAFMLEAIREKVESEEMRAAFHAEARRRLARMKSSGLGVPAGDVFRYLEKRAVGKSARRPRARAVR